MDELLDHIKNGQNPLDMAQEGGFTETEALRRQHASG